MDPQEPFDHSMPPNVEDESDRAQILERLRWTPKQRLAYLVDMISFEQRAHRAKLVR